MIAKLKPIDRVQFQNLLLNWFNKYKRNLPWRTESHWYPIFLSEFLLQQTQVDQVIPYYFKFINRFSNIHDLSRASEQEILALWIGLGYYSRARNILKAAQIIVNDFNSNFPNDLNTAMALPGIGKYTASAILSIAFKRAYAVVDGNVSRVISRNYTIKENIRLTSTQKQIQEICDQLLPKDNPGDYNEAVMELGATICKKQNPECYKCPIQSFCIAYKKNKQIDFPYKSTSPTKKKISHYVYIIVFKNKYLLFQRPASGLLASLWEFPIIEMNKLNLKGNMLELQLEKKYNISGDIVLKGQFYRHKYSHIDLTYQPVLIKVKNNEIKNTKMYVNYSWRSLDDIFQLPIHYAHLNLITWLKSLNQ